MYRPNPPLQFVVFALSLVLPFLAHAGQYGPQAFSFPDGTTNLGDGSTITSDTGVCSVQNNAFRLTQNGVGNTHSAYKLPDLDPGQEINAFTFTCMVRMVAGGNPADGFSINFGAIPGGNGGGESGFALPQGLFVAFDTYDNGGDPRSIEVFADNVSIGNYVQNFNFSDGQDRPLMIHWDSAGLDIVWDGNTVVTNLATPGVVPAPGNSFAFSGRTGGATQDSYFDDLEISTSPMTPVLTDGPVISEFMASNNNTLEDEDLDSPDWVELHNGDTASADLTGYHLTNDPANLAMWTFPAVSMDAFGYTTIFCSGKDRSDPAEVLHTNFTLPAAGGYLALVEPDGTTIASEFTFGVQAADVSYGTLGDPPTFGYLETPTPGSRNLGLQAGGPPAEDVQFSRPGGLISGAITLEILAPVSPTAEVRYTLNNTIPGETSTLYAGPIDIGIVRATNVRARIYDSDSLPGSVSSRTFIPIAADVQAFTSDLPVMVVDSFGVNIDSASSPGSARPFRPVYGVVLDKDPKTGRTSMLADPDWNGRGGMHVRGQSSSGFPKKQYSFEAWNNDNEDRNVSLLGMPSESDWIIHAPYSDKSLMRNVITYACAREIHGNEGGVRTRFIELFYNSVNNNVSMADYRGVYVLMERIKRDAERIDVEELNEGMTDPALISGGYIFKKDKPPHDVTFTTPVEGQLLDFVEPSNPNPAQWNYLNDYMADFENALYGDEFDDPATGYRAYIDMPTWIDNHLFVECFKEIDGYRISAYYAKNRGGKVRAVPVWDYNLGLGNANYLEGEFPAGWYYPQISSYPAQNSQYPWYNRLFEDPEFEIEYWDRYWHHRRGGVLDTANLVARIDAYTAELAEAQVRNFQKWNILGSYVWPNAGGFGSRTTHQAEVDWMKNWLTQRLDWIDDQFRKAPEFNQYGGIVPAGFELTMSDPDNTPNGTIYYTTDGSDPRLPPLPPKGGDPTEHTLVQEADAKRVRVPTSQLDNGSFVNNGGIQPAWTEVAFDDDTWTAGTGGVGYENSSGYQSFFDVNVGPQMSGQRTSCLIRVPFMATAGQLADIDQLLLSIRYDDAYVAYVNGVEIARTANAAGTMDGNSGASAIHNDGAAVTLVDAPLFTVDAVTKAPLVQGQNVLAIHGLNNGTGSSDFLMSPVLIGTEMVDQGTPQVSPTAIEYTAPLTLTESMTIRARIFDDFGWSAITSSNFVVDAVPADASNTVVSEFHYRPAAPSQAELDAGFISRQEFEFLELMNISPIERIDLTEVAFTDGIEFGFAGDADPETATVPPGGRVVIVSNRAAFELRYAQQIIDKSIVIAGAYTGQLANGGEAIEFVDESQSPIKSFAYSDGEPWPVDADGNGFSLVLVDPASNPDHNDPFSWRSSVGIHGCPGGSDATAFAGTPGNDGDNDQIDEFLEYALGTSDADPQASPVIASVQPYLVEKVEGAYLTLSFQRNLAAVGIDYIVELSDDLENWDAANAEYVSTTNNGDGTATVVYRAAIPQTDGNRLYMRLRIEGAVP